MLGITGPQRAAPGSTVCVTITGAGPALDVKAELGGSGLAVSTRTIDGVTTACVVLPAGMRGALVFRASDDGSTIRSKTVLIF